MSLFFTIAYLIAEYMRPQSMYEALAGLPFALLTIIGIILSFVLERRQLNNYNFQNVLIVIFLIQIFISYQFAFNQELARQPLIDFAKLVIIYFLLINIVNERKKLYWFVVVLLLIHFKSAQHLVRQLIALNFNIGTGLFGGAGLFANPGDLGTALVAFWGISYYMIRVEHVRLFRFFNLKWFFIITTITMPIAIVATNTRGASLGCGVSLLYIWYKSKKKFIAAIIIITMILMFTAFIPNWERYKQIGTEEDATGQQRIILWGASIKMANEYPLAGVGPNNFVFVNKNYFGSELQLVQHNIFFQVLSELGYPGLVLFLLMIIGCFYNQWMARKILKERNIHDPFLYWLSHGLDVSLIGFIIAAFFVSVFYYPLFWSLLILSVSLIDSVKKLCRNNS